ncbi:hypothetical protein MtrunA17_Chr4g0025611 [Medicago truncatula]|uniref:Transmembrane protein, putative n=1 Tax=Medicago truncatula TaxID=3880 RepID=A0A072UL07_MEDTR|nr:transmembrane protein, putative [Medicago truncatula]RHN60417.1 hypothetical protein MtrunA17_Chr4g0025611 [Medicago truncatula]
MASKTIFAFVIVLILLFLFMMAEPSGTKEVINRKVLKNNGYMYDEKSVSWDQLRKIPSGPDPLHHNGGTPKPETP